MSRGSRAGRKPVRAPRRPRHSYKPHAWHLGETPGVCAACPLPKKNPVHDEEAIAAAEADRDAAQAEHQRRVGGDR
jgi:hypothetical protein